MPIWHKTYRRICVKHFFKTCLAGQDTRHQLFRYAVVGVLNSLRGYLIYLLITWLWLDPKVAVSLMYPLGVALGFRSHAKYSFGHLERNLASTVRYLIAHLIGYASNVGILYVLVDLLGYPHQLVQLAAIVTVAGILFVLFRHFVFPNRSRPV